MAGWGWLGGRVVGKSDFNENPVISLDLDLDFGPRLRVQRGLKYTLPGTRGGGIATLWPS